MMKLSLILIALFHPAWSTSAALTEETHPQRNADGVFLIGNEVCSESCSGIYSNTVYLAGPCEKATLDFFCRMSDHMVRNKAKSSCSLRNLNFSDATGPLNVDSSRCYCVGDSPKGFCNMSPVYTSANKAVCKYEVSKEFQGTCSSVPQNIACRDSLCSGRMEIQSSITTTDCYPDAPDVMKFCAEAAEAAKYKADSQCDPNNMDEAKVCSCQGDYTVQSCKATPLNDMNTDRNCVITAAYQYQGGCGSIPADPNPSTSDGIDADCLVLKKIHGHKIPVIVTKNLPKNILARALRHIQESKLMTDEDWKTTYLGKFTIPLYRPDIGIHNPAYYELSVYSDPEHTIRAGFIMLTSGDMSARHDYPVAHWNSKGPSITQQLLEPKNDDKKIIRDGTTKTMLWKLDTLSYVATQGENLIARIGDIPPLTQGLTTEIFNQFSSPEMNSEVIDLPYLAGQGASQPLPEDSKLKELYWNHNVSGPVKPPFNMARSENKSFGEYLSAYTKNFQPHIDMLRSSVKQKWSYEDTVGYQVCDTPSDNVAGYEICDYKVDILVPADSKSTISIPFSEAVLVTIHDRNNIFFQDIQFLKSSNHQYPELVLNTKSFPEDVSQLTVDNLSATGVVSVGEKILLRIRFILVANSNQSRPPSWLFNNKEARSLRKLQDYVWNVNWAGSSNDQRCYDQYDYSGCAVGCGPVAWMMLYGWVDLKSSLGVYARSCIYRAGGVSSGSCSAVAPAVNDAGVKTAINNIRNRVHTFCVFGSGATAPWDMVDASGYLSEMGTGTGYRINWNSVGYHSDSLTDRAAEEIVWYGRPAVIGTGWLTHYPLAYGYAWYSRPGRWWLGEFGTQYEERFYINTGWGCYDNGWVGAGTWFAGRVTP